MDLLKRCVTLLCTLALLGSVTLYIPASASINDSVAETNEVDGCRIEDAYVDVSSFTNEDLYYVEICVREDQNGHFAITDDSLLRGKLTAEKYALVLEQIALYNEYCEMATFAATGTENNPYVLDPGVKATVVSSGEYWFE